MSIEIILFGVIALVLVFDFALKGVKKKTTQDDVDRIGEEQSKKKAFNYILARKRNILTFILLVIFFKPIVHYFFSIEYLEIISSDKPIVLFEHSLEDFDLDGESEVIIQLRNLGYKFLIYSSDWDQLSKLRRLARLTIGLLTGGFYKNHTLYECESIPVRHHDLIMAVPK